jgi:hypothetical protein
MSTKKKPSKASVPERQNSMAAHQEAAQTKLVTEAYQNACQGLRPGVLGIKNFGQSMLDSQKALKVNDQKLYDWVRKITGCKKSDATLNNWKRLAKFWTEKVEPKYKAAEKAGQPFTLQDALALIKGKSRPGRKKKKAESQSNANKPTPADAKPEAQSASNAAPSLVEGESDAKPQEAGEVNEEKPISVQPPFDKPDKDRLAAVYSKNGPASTPIQLMTNIIIPGLKKVAEGGVSENDVPFLANAIKEALALIEALKQKYAIS